MAEASRGADGRWLLRVWSLCWELRWRFTLSLAAALANGALAGYLLVLIDTLFKKWSAVQASMDGLVPAEQRATLIDQAVGEMQRAAWTALALAPLAAVVAYIAWYAGQNVANEIMRRLRARYVGCLVSQELAFHDQLARGEMLARMSSDLDRMRHLMSLLFGRLLIRPIEILGCVVVMSWLSWQMGVALVVMLLPLLLIVARLLRRTRARSQQARDSQEKVFTGFEQITAGIRVVKSMGSAQREMDRFAASNDRFATDNRRLARTRAWSQGVTEGSIFLFLGLALFIGGWLFVKELIAPGALVVLFVSAGRMLNAMRELQRVLAEVVESQPSVQRVLEVLDRAPQLRDAPDALPLPTLQRAITFRDVHFRYAATADDVLRGITLDIAAGSTVALVGQSGGGKSTLLDLVARLRDVSGGSVAWDGIDVRRVRHADLIGQVAIVAQDAFLFDDTVRANIAYGRPGATPADIEQAARRAHVHEAILSLEGGLGYDTRVGDRGGRLSGGQRQRVAIARALLRDAPVLLLDEPTSALDADSEHQVQLALKELMRGRTVVVIAHRLATVQHADRIYVIAGKDDALPGTVLESGTHSELIAARGAYARLAERQRLE